MAPYCLSITPKRVLVLMVTSMFFFTCTSTDTVVSASMPTLSKYNSAKTLTPEEEQWNLSTLQLGILYAIAPIMAIVSVFALSFVIRRVGLRGVSIVSCVFMLAGTLVFILVDGYYPKLVGRGVVIFCSVLKLQRFSD